MKVSAPLIELLRAAPLSLDVREMQHVQHRVVHSREINGRLFLPPCPCSNWYLYMGIVPFTVTRYMSRRCGSS